VKWQQNENRSETAKAKSAATLSGVTSAESESEGIAAKRGGNIVM